MSGSNGGGGYSGVYDDETPCEKLRFEAQISSPQPIIVATLIAGDALDISVANMKGQIVVQVIKGDQVAGGLAGPDATRLRNCLDKGHQYRATVRTINGGQVRIFVEHI